MFFSCRSIIVPSLIRNHCRNKNNINSNVLISASRCFSRQTSPLNMATSVNYQAWRVDALDDGTSFQGSEQTLSTEKDLPTTGGGDDVLIQVTHSSLNYKDALSAAGNKGVTRKFPHTPGIDAAGKVVGSGEPVIVTGYDLGMNTAGGYGEFIRVPADWVVPLPFADARTAMVYGTAGLTAGLCVQKILRMGASPAQGKVAVTGGK
jgi:acrylyl-CoA reductase (NADPH)